MTEEQFDTIRAASRDVYVTLPQRHQAETQAAAVRLMQAKHNCDHHYPGGEDARSQGQCKICQSVIVTPLNLKMVP